MKDKAGEKFIQLLEINKILNVLCETVSLFVNNLSFQRMRMVEGFI